MKFDIVFHIAKAHFEVRGYMTSEPMDTTEEEAKDGFNSLQASIGGGKLTYFVVYSRDTTPIVPGEAFASVKVSEILIPLDLYKDAAVHMQLLEVPDGK